MSKEFQEIQNAAKQLVGLCQSAGIPLFLYLEKQGVDMAVTACAQSASGERFHQMMDLYKSSDFDDFVQKAIIKAEEGHLDSMFLKAMGVTKKEIRDIEDLPEVTD